MLFGRRKRSIERLLVVEDEARLADSVEGEQNALLNRVGFTWGRKVRSGYVSLAECYFRLCEGALRMRAWRPDEPWDRGYVQDRLQRALLDGARA